MPIQKSKEAQHWKIFFFFFNDIIDMTCISPLFKMVMYVRHFIAICPNNTSESHHHVYWYILKYMKYPIEQHMTSILPST